MRGPYLLELDGRKLAREILRSVGPDSLGLEWMLDKAHVFPLFLREVKSAAANILKQHMLSLGGEAVVGRWVVNGGREETDVLLLGTVKQYKALAGKLVYQPWGLKDLGTRIENLANMLGRDPKVRWRWPGLELEIGERVLVMGILNITPDSFSDGGRFLEPHKALAQAVRMVEDGADIIDVGGESTRPGSQPVSLEEELNRVMPVLELLLKEIPVPVSLDTYKAGVAREALALGVHIINDVGGGKKDGQMAQVVTAYGAPVIVMHNEKRPEEAPGELIAAMLDDLAGSITRYTEAGQSPEKIMIDPGIGFGKGPQGNLVVLQNIRSFQTLGHPVLLGASRKSFIGAVLNTPVTERLEGSLAAAAWGLMKGVAAVRVHDVRETAALLKMLEAVKNAGQNAGYIDGTKNGS